MGFHGNALELHWIGGQKLRGVYWKREREEVRGGAVNSQRHKGLRKVPCSRGFSTMTSEGKII